MDERDSIQPAALGIMCKAPQPGTTKTRLAAVVGSEQAASLAACFLRDVATVVEAVPENIGRRCYGVYAPKTAEEVLKTILPASFGLLLQEDADFGVVLSSAIRHFLEAGHGCVVLINADSPTLPAQLLTETITTLRKPGDRVVLGPTIDGGYYLIGLKAPHPSLFDDIPWSTSDVYRLTVARARAIGLPVTALPVWYDVDDAETLAWLRDEVAGRPLPFAEPGLKGGPAAATRTCLAGLQAALPPPVRGV
jgi:rSAM/selenodomain-associated transferase 1